MSRQIIGVGDIHGQFHVLHDKKLSGCDVIQVGDFGLGFRTKKQEQNQMEALNKFGVDHDINYFAIRGNHDNPVYTQDPDTNTKFNETYSNIELIPDWTTKIINGKTVLFIGGGVSVDRIHRRAGIDYWPDEIMSPTPEDLGEHDIIISHTAPNAFHVVEDKKGGIVDVFSGRDLELRADIATERNEMNRILDVVKPQHWYFGHFHRHDSDLVRGCNWHCLDINEFKELRI